MHKYIVILVLLAMVSSRCLADDDNANDPIRDALEKAKATYTETIDKARVDLRSAFDSQVQEVAKTGNLEHVKSLLAEKKSFDDDGKLPTSQPMKQAVADYQATMDKAHKTLATAYETAVSDYTKKLQIDRADSVNNEFDAFKKALTAKPASQEKKTADENSGTGNRNERSNRIPEDAVAFKGHHFKYFNDRATWYVARDKCEKMGGHLICIGDADKDSFATSLIEKAQANRAWIGASCEAKEGVWQWVNGEPFSYSHWGSRQPDNTDGIETCLEILTFPGKVMAWNDMAEGYREGFVCEWDR
jgi:hypothetical protein